MTDSSSNGLSHFDSAALENFLSEWGVKINEPTPDEEAEIIANHLRLKDKRLADPSHQQVP